MGLLVGGAGVGLLVGGVDILTDGEAVGSVDSDAEDVAEGATVGDATLIADGSSELRSVAEGDGDGDRPEVERAGPFEPAAACNRTKPANTAHRANPTIRRGQGPSREIMRSLRMRDEEPAPTGRSMSRTWSDYTSR